MKTSLSKSKFLSGLQCEKRLWLEINDSDKATPMSEADERRLEQGTEVGELARERFPGGVLIEFDRFNMKNCIAETEKAMAVGAPIIFEATFLFDDTYVRTDILERNKDNSWDIIEVKSATRVKEEYIPDLAIQKYVLEGSGIETNKCRLMYLNKECVYPDLSNLFVIEDLTNDVSQARLNIAGILESLKSLIVDRQEPDVVIGPHCSDPIVCPFIDYCWQDFGNRTVFDIPRININKQLELRAEGILTIDELPPDYPLSETQRDYVNRILNREINVDKEGIARILADLEYPLYFLDFETFNPAVPRFNGMSPYNQFPFQYSCHVMQENGNIGHFEYLHLDGTDPREPLIRSLLASLGKRGSITCYSVGFEKGILTKLGEAFPNYREELNAISERLWDQKNIFDYYYRDFRFGNTISLKSVLPVLMPKLTYDDLAIKGGAEAQVVWEQMVKTEENDAVKEQMIEKLREYCRMDTLAMVEIHKHLLETLKKGKSLRD